MQTGEADGLTDDEARAALMTAIEAAAPENVMIAGVGRESVFATLALAESAAAAGYDAVAVKAPALAADSALRVELMTFFQAVADRSPLPVVLLSERERLIPAEVLGELAWHPQVIGAVDADTSPARLARLQEISKGVTREVTVTSVFAAATGRMLRAVESAGPGSFVSAESLSSGGAALAVAPPKAGIKTRTKRVGFQILAGSTAMMLDGWSAGASGAVPRLAVAAPQACCEVWQAFRDGDPALAAEKQMRVAGIGERMEGSGGIAAVKYACDLNGYFGGRPRLPLIDLNGNQRGEIDFEMASIRN